MRRRTVAGAASRVAMLASGLVILRVGLAAGQTVGSEPARGVMPPALQPQLAGVGSVGTAPVAVLAAAPGRIGFRISNNAAAGGTTLWCSDVLATSAFVAGGTGSFPILAGTFYEGPAITAPVVCGTASGTATITVESW